MIGADPKGGAGRGVVMSCSYEARRFGVHSGMPISRAYKLCPQAVYLPPNFGLYNQVSERVMTILRMFADRFEQVGIDEAYLDVSERALTVGGVEALAAQIKQALRSKEGLSCSIGVAPNKSTAKIASDYRKPDGLTVVPADQVKAFLAPLAVDKISGVGKKTAAFLRERGIETIGQLQALPGSELTRYFGKSGVWLWGVAQGVEELPVQEVEEVKSISNEHTFETDQDSRAPVRAMLDALAEEVHGRATEQRLLFRTIGIKVRFENFATFTREKTLPDYSDSLDAIRAVAHELFKEFERRRGKMRLVGVRVAHLQERMEEQASLLRWAEDGA